MELYQILAVLVSLARTLFGALFNGSVRKENIDAKRVVADTAKRSVASVVVGAASEIVAPGSSVIVAPIVASAGDKLVKAVTSKEPNYEKLRAFYNDLLHEWFFTDHARDKFSLSLVKKKLIKPLPKKQGLAETVNAIHKDFAGLMPDSTAAITGTWKKAWKTYLEKSKKFGEDKAFNFVDKYFYEALSFQVAPYHKDYILKHENILEPLRQIFWTDKKVISKFVRKHKLTEKDMKDFLLILSSDTITYEDKYDRLAPKK